MVSRRFACSLSMMSSAQVSHSTSHLASNSVQAAFDCETRYLRVHARDQTLNSIDVSHDERQIECLKRLIEDDRGSIGPRARWEAKAR